MARVSTCLNFRRDTEAALNFYRELFGGDIIGPVMSLGDAPACDGSPLPEADRQLNWMINCAQPAA